MVVTGIQVVLAGQWLHFSSKMCTDVPPPLPQKKDLPIFSEGGGTSVHRLNKKMKIKMNNAFFFFLFLQAGYNFFEEKKSNLVHSNLRSGCPFLPGCPVSPFHFSMGKSPGVPTDKAGWLSFTPKCLDFINFFL